MSLFIAKATSNQKYSFFARSKKAETISGWKILPTPFFKFEVSLALLDF